MNTTSLLNAVLNRYRGGVAYTRDRELGRRADFVKLSLGLEIEDLVEILDSDTVRSLTVEIVDIYIDKIIKAFKNKSPKLKMLVERIIVPILVEKKFEKLHEKALRALFQMANTDILKPWAGRFAVMYKHEQEGQKRPHFEELLKALISKALRPPWL